MPLTPQAAAVIDAAREAMPVPLHELGVAALRRATSTVPPSMTPIHHVEDAEVATPAGFVSVRIYRPSEEPDLPVLQYMHGGGYAIGDLQTHDDYLRVLANAAQVVIVSVDYRLAPEHPYPAGLDDCVKVWEWLQSSPVELAADSTRLGMAGDSAGGALAFALALRERDADGRVPDAVVSLYGTTEMRVSNPEMSTPMLGPESCEWFWDLYTPDRSVRDDAYCSVAVAADLSGLGSHLVVTAEYDPTRDATEDYAERLKLAGNDVALHRYDGVMHGFATMVGILPEADDALRRVVTFLHERL